MSALSSSVGCAALNILAQGFVKSFQFFEVNSKEHVLHLKTVFGFVGHYQILSRQPNHFSFSSGMNVPPASNPPPHLVLLVLWTFGHSERYILMFHCFNLHFCMACNLEHLFVYSFDTHVFP